MKIIHSCWTTPMQKQRWNVTDHIEKSLWLYGYSVDYLQRIGESIDLYTDSYGATVFDCLPYNNIIVNLDELDNNEINERFWSAGKILALRDSEIGSIHIDGDVFLKKPEIIPMLDMKGFGVICQMAERQAIFRDSYQELLPMFESAGVQLEGFDYKQTESINAGILTFSDIKFRDKFIAGYFDIINQCQASQEFMSLLKYDLDKKIEPNIVIEQFFLKGLCDANKIEIKYLLDTKSDNFEDDMMDVQRQADKIGFAHCWGSSKFQIIEQIKDILQDRNPKLFNAITAKIEELRNI